MRALGRWLLRLAPVLLGAAVVLLYARTVGFEFIRLDDHDYTFRCLFVRDGLSAANVAEAFANLRHAAIWMPLTYVGYMLDITLFGRGMGGHHGVNVLLHALNAVLFFGLLRDVWRRRAEGADGAAAARGAWLCACAAAFWALHPLRVEPTAWIAGRKELQCGLFTLLGLRAWLRGAVPLAPARPGARWGWIALGWAGCACACLSKPTAMCFPFLACAAARLARRGGVRAEAARWGRLAAAYLPLVLMAAGTGLVAVYSQTHADGYDVRSLYTASFLLRAANALAALGIYVFETFVPVGLHVDVPFPKGGVPPLWWLEALGGCLFAGALAWACRRDRRDLAWCAFFFLAAVAPVLGLFGSFGREAHADRFTYLPGLAFSLLAVTAGGRAAAAAPRRAWRAGGACAAALLAVFAWGAWRLVPTWRTDHAVFSRALACDPDHARALAHVASEECARYGRFGVAIAHYRASLAREWNEGTAGELAFALATHGFKAEGMPHRAAYAAEIRRCCRSALQNPRSDRKGLMLEALGVAAYWERRWQEAAVFFRLAAGVPDQTRLNARDDALARLGVSLANGGRRKEAEQLFAALARPGVAREDVRRFAEQALEQLSSGERVVLFF